jgi:hypothetical protein
MEPIKLIKIATHEVEDYGCLDDFVTEYSIIYDYDTGEIPIGLKIIKSDQYDQESADKDWKQVLEWIEEDERRMNAYGRNWYMFGIRAVATLHFPMRNTESSIIQKIKTPGIYGIESDAEDSFFRENEEMEIAILLDMLENMHVEVPDYFICKLNIYDVETTVGEIRKKYRPERRQGEHDK